MPQPKFIISACLCGQACRYDGVGLTYPRLASLAGSGLALPVCPELLGGLGVPRPPCEIANDRVFTSLGDDVTDNFQRGSQAVLELARKHAIKAAILKNRSPSCGSTMIFDGSFKGRLVQGQGVTVTLLRRNNIIVFSEDNVPEYLL